MTRPSVGERRYPVTRIARKPWNIADLSWSDRALLFRSLSTVVAIRLALWLLAPRHILKFVRGRVDAAPTGKADSPQVRRIGWAIRASSRRVKDASCLTQALAGQLVLAEYGFRSDL